MLFQLRGKVILRTLHSERFALGQLWQVGSEIFFMFVPYCGQGFIPCGMNINLQITPV